MLSSDRYDELSLDGIPELVESINILGSAGTAVRIPGIASPGAEWLTEAGRRKSDRKKLKYGNVHRQIRALVILRRFTENAGKGFKLNWADDQILGRLRDMSQDVVMHGALVRPLRLTTIVAAGPKVKKRLISRVPRLVDPVPGRWWSGV